jgi:hypothetical protein
MRLNVGRGSQSSNYIQGQNDRQNENDVYDAGNYWRVRE